MSLHGSFMGSHVNSSSFAVVSVNTTRIKTHSWAVSLVSEARVKASFNFVFFPLILGGRGMLPFPPRGLWGLLGPNPVHTMGIGQGTPWMSCQLIAGPLLMASAHQEQPWGSVSCSRILQHVAQFCPGEPGFELITSPPALPTELQPPPKAAVSNPRSLHCSAV